METRQIEVAPGVALAVDTWRPEEPADHAHRGFVLVHGLASNARMWDGVAAHLVERGHRAATVDLRGHGRSSTPDGPYDVATVADDLAAVLTTLGWPRPVVAGQSWGGNVVLELSARHPALVAGVVLVDGGWLEPSRRFPSWEACREALAPPRFSGLRRSDVEGYIRSAHLDWPETGIRGALGNFRDLPDGTVTPWLTFDHHMLVLRGLWEHRPSLRYRDVPVPVLLVPAFGDDGRDATKEAAVEEAMTALPRARCHPFQGDHDIHAQHPVELADVMLDCLADGFFA